VARSNGFDERVPLIRPSPPCWYMFHGPCGHPVREPTFSRDQPPAAVLNGRCAAWQAARVYFSEPQPEALASTALWVPPQSYHTRQVPPDRDPPGSRLQAVKGACMRYM
jgi:hypothetical protein